MKLYDDEIRELFYRTPDGQVHGECDVNHEHGQPWVTCLPCGAQWSVNRNGFRNLDFERVTDGDGWCEE